MSDSLMDLIDEAPRVEAPNAETEQPAEWFFDEGVPGVGGRPEYLNPKYKTLAEQAKAHTELEKKLGMTSTPPDMYDFGKLDVDVDNPHIKDMVNYAKEHRISQEAFGALVGGLAGYAEQYAPNMEQELEKLGPNGRQKAKEVSQWAANTLSPERYGKLKEIAISADVIEVLDEIRQNAYKHTSQPPQGGMANDGPAPVTVGDVQREIAANYKRYNSDPAYRNELSQKLSRAAK